MQSLGGHLYHDVSRSVLSANHLYVALAIYCGTLNFFHTVCVLRLIPITNTDCVPKIYNRLSLYTEFFYVTEMRVSIQRDLTSRFMKIGLLV